MRALPFYLLLLMTFGLAAGEKLRGGGNVPEWFTKQFSGSSLDLFPGTLGLSYLAIVGLETTAAILVLLSLVRGEFLAGRDKRFSTWGFGFAQLTFVALGFGQRLTHQYEGAGQLFFYAALTFLGSNWVLADRPKVK